VLGVLLGLAGTTPMMLKHGLALPLARGAGAQCALWPRRQLAVPSPLSSFLSPVNTAARKHGAGLRLCCSRWGWGAVRPRWLFSPTSVTLAGDLEHGLLWTSDGWKVGSLQSGGFSIHVWPQ